MGEYSVVVCGHGNMYRGIGSSLHREDGPAAEYVDGYNAWYLNGRLHREDGPAIVESNGVETWYLNGVSYLEEEYRLVLTSDKDSK